MCGGVASALASPNADAFEARLRRWLSVLGIKLFVTFMCGVASGLASPNADAFEARLHELRAVVGMRELDFVRLMKDGVACRILNAAFFSRLVSCYERRASSEERDMLLRFFGVGVSAIDKLGEATFWQRVEEICTTVPRLTQEAALARLRDGAE
jgi:hypothetical protein